VQKTIRFPSGEIEGHASSTSLVTVSRV